MLDDIRRVTRFAKSHEQKFIRMLMDKSAAESRRKLNSKRRELEKTKRRIEELDQIFRKLYEDRINGILTDQRFGSLSQGYEQDKKI